MNGKTGWRTQISGHVRVLQTIVISFVCILLALLVIVLLSEGLGRRVPARLLPWSMTSFGITWALLALGPLLAIPKKCVAVARRRIARRMRITSTTPTKPSVDLIDQLLRVQYIRIIMCVSLWAAPSVFLILSYKVDRDLQGLVVAMLFVPIVAWQYPTRVRITRWIRKELNLLRDHYGWAGSKSVPGD